MELFEKGILVQSQRLLQSRVEIMLETSRCYIDPCRCLYYTYIIASQIKHDCKHIHGH